MIRNEVLLLLLFSICVLCVFDGFNMIQKRHNISDGDNEYCGDDN